jgi:hypothetical protein
LDDAGSVDSSLDSVESLDDLVECCNFYEDNEAFDSDCEDILEDSSDCLTECLDPCLTETAKDYLDCIQDETGSKGCERQECLDGFLEDLEDDLDFSGDIFDIRNIEKRLEKIDADDLEDCDLLEDFVEAVCDVGDDCCDDCQSELGLIVDCLINDIVIPFVALELNKTIAECPIDTDNCELEGGRKTKMRDLKKGEEVPFTKAMSLPKGNAQTKRDKVKEKFLKNSKNRRLEEGHNTTVDVDACEAAMNTDIITSDVSTATNKFMECVTAAAITSLEDVPEEGASDAAAVFKIGALVVTLVGSFLAL